MSGISQNLLSQADLFGVLSELTRQPVPEDAVPDSFSLLSSWLGQSDRGCDYVVQLSTDTLSLVSGEWKHIAPSKFAQVQCKKH